MTVNQIKTKTSHQNPLIHTNPLSITRTFSFSRNFIDDNDPIFSSTIETHPFIRAPSSSSLLGSNTEDNSDDLGASILSRGVLLGYFSVICLFIVTLKVNYDKYASPQMQGTTHSSSQKLGAAAIGSLTTAFSPILPFTGGADLRRGEYPLAELLPTGAFDTWDSVYLWGKDLATKTKPKNEASESSGGSIVSGIPRGGAKSLSKKERIASKKQIDARKIVISAPEPFLSLEEIGKMTLADLAHLMEYSIDANREGFNDKSFTSKLSPRMQESVKAVDTACAKSRGSDVLPAKTIMNPTNTGKFGNIDALQFCAVMRVFAEWRILRQVPEGFKGYAVGMGLGHKDVVQNLVKVETAIFTWIEERKERIRLKKANLKALKESGNSDPTSNNTMSDSLGIGDDPESLVLRSPTLHELLQDEVDFDVHDGKLPRLKEKSAAMGLLWVRRQLQYQTAIFANVRSGKYSDVPSAVGAAYKEVYDRYHGWAVQKIFNYSFQAAPLAEEIYKIMNPVYLEEVLESARGIPSGVGGDQDEDERICMTEEVIVEKPTTKRDNANIKKNSSRNDFEKQLKKEQEKKDEMGLVMQETKQSPFERFGHFIATEWDKLGQHIGGEIEKFVTHIGNEWDKLATNTLSIFGVKLEEKLESTSFKQNAKSKSPSKGQKEIRGGGKRQNDRTGITGKALEEYVNEKMTKNAHTHMEIYLKVAKPLLKNLEGLFDELNMDDPTKV